MARDTSAVFLDRDGVVNDAPVVRGRPMTPSTATAFVLLPGVQQAVGRLRDAGYLTILVTNQPDVARGRLDRSVLEEIHHGLRGELDLNDVVVCPHDNAHDCRCRKPRPGMLVQAAERHGVDLARSWMVGDRWVDIAAGRAAGTRTVLIRRDYSWSSTSSGAPDEALKADVEAANLTQAVAAILERDRGRA